MGRFDENGKLTLDELHIDETVLRSIDKIIVIACGTAAYAGMVARYAIEHWCRIPTEVELAHEFRYRDPIVNEKTLVVALSQSGETMDTLMAVRHAREQGAKVIAICNTNGSSIPRESDACLYTHAGPEIAVASTKAFLAQIAAVYLLGLYLAELRGNMFADEVHKILDELREIPEKIQKVIDNEDQVKELGRSMKDATSVLFLGRHVGFPVALEGALKLKEIAYLHAEGFAAGELKHGPIALVEEGQPVFIIVPSPGGRESLHSKVVSNIQEVRARGAITIVIAEEGDVVDVFTAPQQPITKEFISVLLSNELPTAFRGNPVEKTPSEGSYMLLRLTFLGERADDPVLAEMIRRFPSIEVTMLFGTLDQIKELPFGRMIIGMRGAPEEIQRAIDYLSEQHLKQEVIGYVRRNDSPAD